MSALLSLTETFKGRAPLRPNFAAENMESGADLEDPSSLREPLEAKGADSDLIGITIGIEYVDSAGSDVSRRWITINKIAEIESGHIAVDAYCFMREDIRTFRVSRIINIFDEKGESFHVRDFFGLSGKTRDGAPLAAASRKLACRDGMRVLIAVARSDGHLHPREKDVIAEYALKENARNGIDATPKNTDFIQRYIERQQPSGDVVVGCLERLAKKDAASQDVLMDYLQQTILADGDLAVQEAELFSRIHNRLHN